MKTLEVRLCTCISSIDDEVSRLKRTSFAQSLAGHSYPTGVCDLGLLDHDRNGAAGNMATVFLDVDEVLARLFGYEGHT